METLAKAVKRAAEIQESSWDKKDLFYKIGIKEASEIAARECGYDTRGAQPIFLLLYSNWGDILEWTQLFNQGRYRRIDLHERLAAGEMLDNICEEWFSYKR